MRTGFGQFCPIANACEIFAKPWTPIILRELFAGSHRFNEIHRCIPLISRALLARRLRELEAVGVIVSKQGPSGKGGPGLEHHLTPAGEEFRPVLDALGTWGQRWAVRIQPHNLDAGLLMWNLRRRLAKERLPNRRVVVHFFYQGLPASYRGSHEFWMILERSAADVCLRDPGYEIDLCVDADTAAMVRIWLGDQSFADAVRTQQVCLTGDPQLAREFPSWLLLSPFAGVPRPST